MGRFLHIAPLSVNGEYCNFFLSIPPLPSSSPLSPLVLWSHKFNSHILVFLLLIQLQTFCTWTDVNMTPCTSAESTKHTTVKHWSASVTIHRCFLWNFVKSDFFWYQLNSTCFNHAITFCNVLSMSVSHMGWCRLQPPCIQSLMDPASWSYGLHY